MTQYGHRDIPKNEAGWFARFLSADFVARVGAAVFAPAAAARRICQGGPGGLSDMLWLLPVCIITGDGQRLAREVREAAADGGGAAVLAAILRGAQVVVPDVLLILLGGVVLGLLLGQRGRRLRPGTTMDLSALAWMGWFFVLSGSSLVLTLLRHDPGERLRRVTQMAALGLFGIIWLQALVQAHLATGDDGKTTP